MHYFPPIQPLITHACVLTFATKAHSTNLFPFLQPIRVKPLRFGVASPMVYVHDKPIRFIFPIAVALSRGRKLPRAFPVKRYAIPGEQRRLGFGKIPSMCGGTWVEELVNTFFLRSSTSIQVKHFILLTSKGPIFMRAFILLPFILYLH